jgi:hypothetical protein
MSVQLKLGWMIVGLLAIIGLVLLAFLLVSAFWMGNQIFQSQSHTERIQAALDEQCSSEISASDGYLRTFPELIWSGQGENGNGAMCYYSNDTWSCSCYIARK